MVVVDGRDVRSAFFYFSCSRGCLKLCRELGKSGAAAVRSVRPGNRDDDEREREWGEWESEK